MSVLKSDDGLFLRIDSGTLGKVYSKLGAEGYPENPAGIVRFLEDVASGKLDEPEATSLKDHLAKYLKDNPDTPSRVLDALRTFAKGSRK